MPEHIELPPTLTGDTKNQIQQIWRYLYQTSEIINRNTSSIGGNEVTDKERVALQGVLDSNEAYQTQSLKDMLMNLAEYVKKNVKEQKTTVIYQTDPISETTETDYDDLTATGRYWVSAGSMSNGPTGLSSGTCLAEVMAKTGFIVQRITTSAKIYIRTNTSGTWGSWWDYTGTEEV